MKLVKMAIQYGVRRALEIWIPALAFFSVFHIGVYLIEFAI